MKTIVIHRTNYNNMIKIYNDLFKQINERFYPKVTTGYGRNKKIVVRDKVCIYFTYGFECVDTINSLAPIYGFFTDDVTGFMGMFINEACSKTESHIRFESIESVYLEVENLAGNKKKSNNQSPYEDIFAAAGYGDDQFELAKFCREFGFDPYAIIALLNNMKRRDEL